MNKKLLQSNTFKWLLYLVVIFFLFLALLGGSYWYFLNKYEKKMMPGIKIGGLEAGGLSYEEAKEKLSQRLSQINQEGVSLKYEGAKINLTPKISSLSGDISYEIIDFKTEPTLNKAFSLGREKNFWGSLIKQLSLLKQGEIVPVQMELNEKEVKKIIQNNFKQFEIPAQNATLVISTSSDSTEINCSIEKEKVGKIINYEKALKKIRFNLSMLDNSTVILTDKIKYPEIHKRDCLNIEPQTQKLLTRAPIILKYEEESWEVDNETLAKWLELEKRQEKIEVGLSENKIKKYLEKNVVPKINEEPVDARFEIEDGKVTQFKASQDGIEVKLDKTVQNLKEIILNSATTTVQISTQEVASKINIDNANNLGIKEIVGTGHSNFAGSPANRIHNIEVGAQSITGLIIKPGEEFSLVGALGAITAETGYKPELVIKGNKTVPEYGGGLCQIGTTMFRTALNAGLKITERRSHSYRVSYYEPAGTDATIYNPKPDFRFVNDTDSNLLIQHRIEGYDLYFDLWGTDDGRQVTTTDPTIYNITHPGPTKIIETTDLDPGQRKCTESAHNGADAYFDYIIKYPEGETRERRFHSSYSPWRAVCLEGVEKMSTEEEEEVPPEEKKEEQATSSEE